MDIKKASENLCFYLWDYLYANGGAANIDTTAISYVTFGIFVLTSVIGLLGNAIVIYITGFKIKKQKSKIWFLNMAVADFLFLLWLPLDATNAITGNWPFGSYACKLYHFFSTFNMYTSIFIMTALNVDRAISVAKPLWHHKFVTQTICYRTCTCIWILTALSSLPALFVSAVYNTGGNQTVCSLLILGQDDQEYSNSTAKKDVFSYAGSSLSISNTTSNTNNDHGTFIRFPHLREQCIDNECCANEETVAIWSAAISKTLYFIISIVVIGYFIPLCVILISNGVIFCQIWKSQSTKTSRAYQITVSVVLVYFITWTPLIIAYIVFLTAMTTMNISLVFNVSVFLTLLNSIAYTNSCLNPIIYVLIGKQARDILLVSIKSLTLKEFNTSSKRSTNERTEKLTLSSSTRTTNEGKTT
ncbi:C3a anaphylatoxin chemotactic receptor [Xenopus laevis]|uniref:C3a anaphylatoxin chemotactic receptor n=1 Tax=Xenopus laevis TaxID=8355 RepID=A0A8J0U5P2_XENLA|nr:C3a anaphylatoxin chemotactic receptor [Xenopus laevis]OCT57737.1 hypothetical protein XELAEV_18003073mg [Xenopus laevis]